MKIYIDNEFKCHVNPDADTKTVETDFFDGMCTELIEGYRYVPSGERWTREDGKVFVGEMIAPWKPYDELDAVQRQYERYQLAETQTALSILFGEVT